MSADEDAAAGAPVLFFGNRGHNNNTGSRNSNEPNVTYDNGASNYFMKQYAQDVWDFSSQYGGDSSISYSARNITGKPSKYPEYGDFPETFAMRTYGNWWDRAPSRQQEIQSQNFPPIPAHDFIVVFFENYIIPEELIIYETYCPGAVVRIWAYTIARTWVCLWEAAASDFYQTRPPARSRNFSPPLKRLQLPTMVIRLEFNQWRLHYYTQIDALLLSGINVNSKNVHQLLEFYERKRTVSGSIVRKLSNIQFQPSCQEMRESTLQNFLTYDLTKFITASEQNTTNTSDADCNKAAASSVGFNDIPFEIMLQIFSYLDLITLFRVGQVSRFCYEVSRYPLLYSEINLKPYWHMANSELLSTLTKRATMLKKFDLSWCGLFSTITSKEFKKFVQQCGHNLTHLRLNSCKFLNASCIDTLGIVCENLKELSLRNCATDPPIVNFSCLGNLKNLERLDLFKTRVPDDLILTMLQNNPKLKHLNLAFSLMNMQSAAMHIGRYNQQLVSLDMWKSLFLNPNGLRALANCRELEEVDFGWCLRDAALGDSFIELLTNCTKLKKVFLAAVRGLTDRDVENIANLCPDLEQLDLMGVLGLSKDRYYNLLRKCKKLKLLDLSFCDNIDENEIALWAHAFSVQIKCSHMPTESR